MAISIGVTTELVERDGLRASLGRAHAGARDGRGSLVFVGGEAGVGKTSLARRFSADLLPAPVVWGACDPLATPRPLGPLLDLAPELPGRLATVLESEATPYDVVAALADAAQESALVVVLEDVHWADEATLDVLRVAGRRIEGLPLLLVATYRDDELDRAHPLRVVLGELATAIGVVRLELPPLSADAVRTLAEPHGVDADALHRSTGGNPFYVTEVLSAPAAAIPATVRDAVLARAARLSPPARELLERLAVVPGAADPELIDAADEPLDEC
ncbi:MAG TPA: AAA family ATPase, partial [Gaiella sp.]|nr:AAA family ATPase [Gaiella sp.]